MMTVLYGIAAFFIYLLGFLGAFACVSAIALVLMWAYDELTGDFNDYD